MRWTMTVAAVLVATLLVGGIGQLYAGTCACSGSCSVNCNSNQTACCGCGLFSSVCTCCAQGKACTSGNTLGVGYANCN
jgi:hypothetical protein